MTELVKKPEAQMTIFSGVEDTFTHEDANEIQNEKAFLPYLKFVQGLSPLRQPPYEFRDGSFALHRSKTNIEQLPLELDCTIVLARPLAIDYKANPVLITTDQHSDDFMRIREEADKNRGNFNCGFQWGYDLLLWIPCEETFATFWCNNRSLQRWARFEVIGTKSQPGHLRKPLTLFGELIKDKQGNKTYSYQVIRYRENNVPCLEPDPDDLDEVCAAFKEGRMSKDAIDVHDVPTNSTTR